MKRVLIAVALLAASSLANASQRNTFNSNTKPYRKPASLQRHCFNNYTLEFIKFDVQWTTGVCRTDPQECRNKPSADFTIHGLWPSLWHSRDLNECCFENKFDVDKLTPIMSELNEHWPSLHGKSASFWSHEWLKHGTCARDVKQLRGELSYFNTTIQLFKSLQILKRLASAGIKPNDERPINSKSLQETLAGSVANGKRVTVGCDYEHSHSIPILTHLDFCLDSNLTFIDCPPTSSKCSRQLIMPLDAQLKRQPPQSTIVTPTNGSVLTRVWDRIWPPLNANQ